MNTRYLQDMWYGEIEKIHPRIIKYSQTCVKQAPMGKPKTGCLRQVLA